MASANDVSKSMSPLDRKTEKERHGLCQYQWNKLLKLKLYIYEAEKKKKLQISAIPF